MKFPRLNHIDLNLRKAVLFFFSAGVVLFGVGFPLKNKAQEYSRQVFLQHQSAIKFQRISQAVALNPLSSSVSAVSLVSALEEEVRDLGLQKKVAQLLPEKESVTFELIGIDLKDGVSLLSRIERERRAGKVTALRLTPQSEEPPLFSLRATIQKK